MAISQKTQRNIWVAAGDGDLERVRDLIEHESISPNAPDPFTYTPMHAAASYGHIQVLEYLISRGGDVNITDSDGDTPIYTVENIETARYLVEKGAVVDRVNAEGISPIDHLAEDFPQVSEFLQAFSSNPSAAAVTSRPSSSSIDSSSQSQYAQNLASEQLTSSLLSSVQDLVDQGVDPEQVEEELRRRVGEAVLNGLLGGYALTTQQDAEGASATTATGAQRREPPSSVGDGGEIEGENKRPRMED